MINRSFLGRLVAGVVCCTSACRQADLDGEKAPGSSVSSPSLAESPPDTAGCRDAVTSLRMRICASAEFRDANRQLSALIDSLAVRLDSASVTRLSVSSRQWNLYRERECEVLRSVYAGGTMESISMLSCFVDLTKARTQFLHAAFSAQLNNSHREAPPSSDSSDRVKVPS